MKALALILLLCACSPIIPEVEPNDTTPQAIEVCSAGVVVEGSSQAGDLDRYLIDGPGKGLYLAFTGLGPSGVIAAMVPDKSRLLGFAEGDSGEIEISGEAALLYLGNTEDTTQTYTLYLEVR